MQPQSNIPNRMLISNLLPIIYEYNFSLKVNEMLMLYCCILLIINVVYLIYNIIKLNNYAVTLSRKMD